MSMELLREIEQAEHKAEETRLSAVREAREIIKAVEEATVINARQASKDIRDGAQRLIEEAKLGTEDEIKSLEVRRGAEHEALRILAQSRLENAARMIFERTVRDGNR